MPRPNSAFVVSLTPFTERGALDEPGLRAHLQRLGRSGIGVYVAGSGSGEGYTLTIPERRRVMEIAAEELAGTVPVRVMGVEPRTAAEAIALGVETTAAGLDAMQLYSLDMGHGYQPRREEVQRYLFSVLDAVDCPVVVSTHQSVGYHYRADLLDDVVSRYEQVIGINVTSGDIGYLAEVVDVIGGRVEVHVGGPMHALTAVALGAQGYLSSEGNLAPRLCTSLFDRPEVFAQLIRVFRLTQAAGGIVGTKAALRAFDAPGGWPREPRLDPAAASVDALVELLRSSGLAEAEGLV